MEREGVRISRKLLSQWVIRIEMALKPLYEQMQNRILSSQNIYIDETPVKLQEAIKCKQAYMWIIVGGNESNPPYRVYDFRESTWKMFFRRLMSHNVQKLHELSPDEWLASVSLLIDFSSSRCLD